MSDRAFVKGRNVSLWTLCSLFLCLVILTGTLAPWIVPHDPNHVDMLRKFAAPSFEYPLGTDHLGRCIWSRLLMAIRYSFGGAVLVLTLTLAVGAAAGIFTALKGGWFDTLFMRLCDIGLAFPTLVLSFVLLGIFGPGFLNLVLAMVLSQWIYYARIIRSMVLGLQEQPFIRAAIVCGTRRWMLIIRHILPNIALPALVLATLELGGIVLEMAGFTFLGLGVQAPAAEWGMMVSDGKAYIRQHPELMLYPGLAIMLMVAAFNWMGESLRAVYDTNER
jgi:ABC-type dipeptide/oligopeptide/nickel transport system permease subunit